MSDYIMRQDAIDTHCAICPDKDKCPDGDFICPDRELFRMIKPAYPDLDESCEDCPLYDKENHFCPRFCRVIPDTIKELEQNAQPKWILCKERLPENIKGKYWVCTDTEYQCECRWTNNRFGIGEGNEWGWNIFDTPRYSKVIAWMPLPEPYKEEDDEID